MVSPYINIEANQPDLKVSISARLMAVLAYLIPVIGGALSSLYLMNVMRALKQAETAGIGAVFGGMAESTLPALILLYLGAVCGLVVIIIFVIRAFMQTKTASPTIIFFIFCGILLLVPAGLFFEAESIIIEVLIAPVSSTGIAGVASNINLFLILSIASALFLFILMFVVSVIPFSARSKPKLSPLIGAVLVEILLIAAVAVFQWRYLWLYNTMMSQ